MPKELTSTHTLELHGIECPNAFVRTKLVMETLAAGESLRVVVDNALSKVDLPRSAQQHGYAVLGVEEIGSGVWAITLCKPEKRPGLESNRP